MEKPSHVSEGFFFSSSCSDTTTVQIQNHNWVVVRKITNSYSGVLLKFQRPESSKNVDVCLILFVRSKGQLAWQKVKKNFLFPKSLKKIEITVEEYSNEYNTDCLIGMVSVSFLDSYKTDDKKSNVGSASSSAVISSQLSKDLAHLLDSDVSSDYVLKCAGKEFHVHKCILAARSSVFATMFHFYKNAQAEDPNTKAKSMDSMKHEKVQDCTQETSTASIQAEDIIDIKPEILMKMLKYIYSGQIDDITSTEAGDLLYAADKYQLNLLKEICVDKLKSTLSASNVLDMLVIGDLHDESLKAHAMNFICKYPSLSELKKMDQWKSLQTTNPTMVIEVLTSVVGYLQDSKK